jgi:branched-chain amino acid transport system substrate-binding protein
MSGPGGALPALIGVLYDYPQVDGGSSVEEAIRLGLETSLHDSGFDRPVEFVVRHGRGLPSGSAHEMERSFREITDEGALLVIGPSISDNCLIIRDLCDEVGVPGINYSGGERTRSDWMFHYQVGSLEEEPLVLARYLARQSIRSVAVAHDHSPVGRGYAEHFAQACADSGIDLVGSGAVSPMAADVGPVIERLKKSDPESLVYLGLGVAARAVALAIEAQGWPVTVVANSSLMFGYSMRDWRAGWEGWTYTDTVSDHNEMRNALRERSRASAAGPVGVAVYDIGRLAGAALSRTAHLTRDGLREALEGVKRLDAASGLNGTIMGFGCYDHAALKGPYLVLRRWEGGKTVELAEQ